MCTFQNNNVDSRKSWERRNQTKGQKNSLEMEYEMVEFDLGGRDRKKGVCHLAALRSKSSSNDSEFDPLVTKPLVTSVVKQQNYKFIPNNHDLMGPPPSYETVVQSQKNQLLLKK